MNVVQKTTEDLLGVLRDYIEARYHISSPQLIMQRRRLLDELGIIHQQAYLEATPRYKAGRRFNEIASLSPAVLSVFDAVASESEGQPRLIYDPPYEHQWESVRRCVAERESIIVTTGTGSGKTECFLLPILGKLAHEAESNPQTFSAGGAIRALVLYPMNALVNDQLGRLRELFGDSRIVDKFVGWAGRPARFARYTSRTPYAGVRTPKRDQRKLESIKQFFVKLERDSVGDDEELAIHAAKTIETLRDFGRWPAKPSVTAWYGEDRGKWQDRRTGEFLRAVTLHNDVELITRQEVQDCPPDLLITNYSMLEYMMMRPVEQGIFDKTKDWLGRNAEEKFLLVLDEAHLYRGAPGAEVALLLRRLRDRLSISEDRLQVICTTASFSNNSNATKFAAQLSGAPVESFNLVEGVLATREIDGEGTSEDVEVLGEVDIDALYRAGTEKEEVKVVERFLVHRGVKHNGRQGRSTRAVLADALTEYPPMGRLMNITMQEAVTIGELAQSLFPDSNPERGLAAVSSLLGLGSFASESTNGQRLLACRVHNFFRGIPGLWICMNPECDQVDEDYANEICGSMYSQPRERCECGARVFELYTCIYCGTAYARAYTDNISSPRHLWAEPGSVFRGTVSAPSQLRAIDILLETPTEMSRVEAIDFDVITGGVDGKEVGDARTLYIPGDRMTRGNRSHADVETASEDRRGLFTTCAVCEESMLGPRDVVQDHQTKGDQPFQALITKQIHLQPPLKRELTQFAPLQGRKCLIFSDSRQVAARLAPNLQRYSIRDSLRSLVIQGYRRLQDVTGIRRILCLGDVYFAVLLASVQHRVRLHPELHEGVSANIRRSVEQAMKLEQADADEALAEALMEARVDSAPAVLVGEIAATIQDRFAGLESLALASVSERVKHAATIIELPDLPGVAETEEAKLGVARAWLRTWRNYGFWLNGMPNEYWQGAMDNGMGVRGRKKVSSRVLKHILTESNVKQIFDQHWVPVLFGQFTESVPNNGGGELHRLRGSEVSLQLSGNWVMCERCKSVHRPLVELNRCLDCGGGDVVDLDPDSNTVFLARKGYYRSPAVAALRGGGLHSSSIVAAEHTAQLNAPQHVDVFSRAEKNELLFQDIKYDRQSIEPAVDVLSSTTTMEVGIDIGSLAGVALRNMPPARSNYQQRAGRAGRRGHALATVVAYASVDSHDAHYFTSPQEMVRGPVVDPQLTLDNADITLRHVRAFLLQCYHQYKIPAVTAEHSGNLFSVLGTVGEFRQTDTVLNFEDFKSWLRKNSSELQQRVRGWLPTELPTETCDRIVGSMVEDCIHEIGHAVELGEPDAGGPMGDDDGDQPSSVDIEPQVDDEKQFANQEHNELLNRLLYCGVLPRYAFPTDVASFYVFDAKQPHPGRPRMKFAPSQSLAVALTQYAPGKPVWISGKCYTSGAVYSVLPADRANAWENRRVYLECTNCSYALTLKDSGGADGHCENCPACGGIDTLGPACEWIRPPNFAHPVDEEPLTAPDDFPEPSYATRAKLSMRTPDKAENWLMVNDRVRVLYLRDHLLVSNTGPRKMGYAYCRSCGRIDAMASPNNRVERRHKKPFPVWGKSPYCRSEHVEKNVVLGTDFVTDIALFSFSINDAVDLSPKSLTTSIAMRTISEAIAAAAARLLDIEPTELMGEYRPALTSDGPTGREAEVFLYDTLPGGAGFCSQLQDYRNDIIPEALDILKQCEGDCDASCYSCLRSFKNKFEHQFLDRHVGWNLLEYLDTGIVAKFDERRIAGAARQLQGDLGNHLPDGYEAQLADPVSLQGEYYTNPVIVCRGKGDEVAAIVTNPLSYQSIVQTVEGNGGLDDHGHRLVVLDELVVRHQLHEATQAVVHTIDGTR